MTSILVIDDEMFVRTTLRLTLETEGFKVIEAEDGVVGLQKFVDERPAAVLVDMIMPNKAGVQTIVEIRKLAPTAPIIAMSGGGRVSAADLLVAARTSGADDVVQKPFQMKELISLVKRRVGMV
jgi:two-component system, chemotaxis family, chemotaxis protein CheY